ncbi:MAG: hypothetical protein CL512_05965 [Actinobacteria bacterium]|nr:hypothetical protein [Actinomycetota bacterium]
MAPIYLIEFFNLLDNIACMAFTYCPSCGYKNLHGVKVPAFCGGCGESLEVGVSKAKASAEPAPKKRYRVASELRGGRTIVDDSDSEESDVVTIPNVDELKYTINEGDDWGNKMSLKDISGEITEDQLGEVQAAERGTQKRKPGRPKGSKNSSNAKSRKRKR